MNREDMIAAMLAEYFEELKALTVDELRHQYQAMADPNAMTDEDWLAFMQSVQDMETKKPIGSI